MIFWTLKYANTQIQFLKYTNTAYEKVSEIPDICYIYEKSRVQGLKNYILDSQIRKYTNTISQIHKYSVSESARNIQHMPYCPPCPNCPSFQKLPLDGAEYCFVIPDICPFWYATILFGLQKVRQKSA